jgi:hypothetical protein
MHHVLREMPQRVTRAQCTVAMREPSAPLLGRVSQRARHRRGSHLGSLRASPTLAHPFLIVLAQARRMPPWQQPSGALRHRRCFSNSGLHCVPQQAPPPSQHRAPPRAHARIALGHQSALPPWPWLPLALLLRASTWSQCPRASLT